MRRKKIALLTSSLRAGGAERVVATLHQNLKDDYDVHLLLFSDQLDYELDSDAKIIVLDNEAASSDALNILKIPLLARRLAKYCRENEIDIVLAFLSRPNFVACLAKKLGLRAKVLISERIYTPLWYRDGTLRGRIGKWLTQTLYPFADAILPNSTGTRKALEEQYGIKNRYFVVKNPVALTTIDRLKDESVDDVSFGSFTFVCVARFLEQKNHDLLVEAFAGVAGDCRLLLIGEGPLLPAVDHRAARLGVADRVNILGKRSNPFKYVSRSDCFVLASDFEGFPNVIIESMACGTPVISTDCLSGPRELLAPGSDVSTTSGIEVAEFGILVPVRDRAVLSAAMQMMMDESDVRDRLGRAGSRRAEDFEESVVVNEFCSIIEESLSEDFVENSHNIMETQ